MKLCKGSYENFGSYSSLEIDFADQGLTKIVGDTGSGKSTLMDAPAWCIYGRTSKDGTADEVKSWHGNGEATRGSQEITCSDGRSILVTRVRGTARENDLFWYEPGSDSRPVRGKDIADTQRLLEARIGVSADTYFTGAYFTQFSGADAFFVAKAKERREILEQIVDLSLPVKIGERASEVRRQCNKDMESNEQGMARLGGRLEVLSSSLAAGIANFKRWEPEHAARIDELESYAACFQSGKDDRIADLNCQIKESKKEIQSREELDAKVNTINESIIGLKGSKCKSCGASNDSAERLRLHKQLQAAESERYVNSHKLKDLATLKKQLEEAQASVSPYEDQLKAIRSEKNPYADQIKQTKAHILKTKKELTASEASLGELSHRRDGLTRIYNLSLDLRGALLEQAIVELELTTNEILESYFDGELRIEFTMDADKLDIAITKNGYDCSFRQLSGGQRCELKLSFAVALMNAAANKVGVHFDNLFFDEPLAGLDENLKLRAFSLFEELERHHGSVFVIDHDASFKALFSNRYSVKLVGDVSELEKVDA